MAHSYKSLNLGSFELIFFNEPHDDPILFTHLILQCMLGLRKLFDSSIESHFFRIQLIDLINKFCILVVLLHARFYPQSFYLLGFGFGGTLLDFQLFLQSVYLLILHVHYLVYLVDFSLVFFHHSADILSVRVNSSPKGLRVMIHVIKQLSVILLQACNFKG